MCVYKYAQMRTCRFHGGHRRLNIIALYSSCLFCIKWKMLSCQMKGNEEKYMLGEELALFTHHHRDWSLLPFLSLVSGLNWEILHLKFMHIFLWNVYCAPDASAQLGNVLHFIKNISSQPLSGLETRLFINEPFSPLWFLHTLKWVETSWNPSFLLICQDYSELGCFLPQRHQTVKRWANRKDSEWVKSLHLVYTESTTPQQCRPQLEMPSY